MKVTIVGTGRMGQGLVRIMAPVYDHLLWVGRDRQKVAGLIEAAGFGSRVQAADHKEGLTADVIFLALWHRDMPAFVAEHRAQLAGKIVINMANPFTEDFTDFTTPWDRSAAEEFQELIPEARVIGAFKNTFWVIFDQPQFPEGESDCYVTSDDEEAKQTVMRLLEPLPFRVLDAGPLKNNRTIERMTLLSREVAKRYGHYPRTTWRLLGQSR